jgi:hypothetical protein
MESAFVWNVAFRLLELSETGYDKNNLFFFDHS